MSYIYYYTKEDAEMAQDIIFQNRQASGLFDVVCNHILTPQITSRWATPEQRGEDGLWGFEKPDNLDWMVGVQEFVEEGDPPSPDEDEE